MHRENARDNFYSLFKNLKWKTSNRSLSQLRAKKKETKKKHWEIKGRLDDAERKIFVVSITECKYDDEKNTNTINISLISLVRIIESTFFPEGLT